MWSPYFDILILPFAPAGRLRWPLSLDLAAVGDRRTGGRGHLPESSGRWWLRVVRCWTCPNLFSPHRSTFRWGSSAAPPKAWTSALSLPAFAVAAMHCAALRCTARLLINQSFWQKVLLKRCKCPVPLPIVQYWRLLSSEGLLVPRAAEALQLVICIGSFQPRLPCLCIVIGPYCPPLARQTKDFARG